MFKKLTLLFLLLIGSILTSSAYYDLTTPIEGKSIATDNLQYKVMKSIYKELSKQTPSCIDYKVVNSQIIQYPYDIEKKNNKFIKGYWKELWSIDVCGKYEQIPITFEINKRKTIFKIDEYFLPK